MPKPDAIIDDDPTPPPSSEVTVVEPSPLGATFAERKAARLASLKRVASAQNKAVKSK